MVASSNRSQIKPCGAGGMCPTRMPATPAACVARAWISVVAAAWISVTAAAWISVAAAWISMAAAAAWISVAGWPDFCPPAIPSSSYPRVIKPKSLSFLLWRGFMAKGSGVSTQQTWRSVSSREFAGSLP